jgi:hypothetical protein
VVALLAAPALATAQVYTPIPLTAGSFNQDVVIDAGATPSGTPANYNNFITATMDNGTAKTGNTWYQIGQNTSAPTTGIPMGTTFASQGNPGTRHTTFTTQPANGKNVMMLDSATTSGTMTFSTPTTLAGLNFLVASGNGAGTLALNALLQGGTSVPLGNITALDWFPGGTFTSAYVANGRVDNGNGTTTAASYNNVNNGNPQMTEVFVDLPAAATTSPITGISFAWTGGANTHTVIFGISGATAVPEPGSLALCGLGLSGLVALRRRMRRAVA